MITNILIVVVAFCLAIVAQAADGLEIKYNKAEAQCEAQAKAMKDAGMNGVPTVSLLLPDQRSDLKKKAESVDGAKFCKCDFETSKQDYGLEVAAWLHDNYGIAVTPPSLPPDKLKNDRREKLTKIFVKCLEKL